MVVVFVDSSEVSHGSTNIVWWRITVEGPQRIKLAFVIALMADESAMPLVVIYFDNDYRALN